MPKEIVRLATQFMRLPLQIEVARAGTLVEKVKQEFFIVQKVDRLRLLDTLVAPLGWMIGPLGISAVGAHCGFRWC